MLEGVAAFPFMTGTAHLESRRRNPRLDGPRLRSLPARTRTRRMSVANREWPQMAGVRDGKRSQAHRTRQRSAVHYVTLGVTPRDIVIPTGSLHRARKQGGNEHDQQAVADERDARK